MPILPFISVSSYCQCLLLVPFCSVSSYCQRLLPMTTLPFHNVSSYCQCLLPVPMLPFLNVSSCCQRLLLVPILPFLSVICTVLPVPPAGAYSVLLSMVPTADVLPSMPIITAGSHWQKYFFEGVGRVYQDGSDKLVPRSILVLFALALFRRLAQCFFDVFQSLHLKQAVFLIIIFLRVSNSSSSPSSSFQTRNCRIYDKSKWSQYMGYVC